MYDSAVGHAVRLSFKQLADHKEKFSDADTLILRRRIEAAVDDLKSMNWPIERIVVRIKELASEVGVRLGHDFSQLERHPAIAQAVMSRSPKPSCGACCATMARN